MKHTTIAYEYLLGLLKPVQKQSQVKKIKNEFSETEGKKEIKFNQANEEQLGNVLSTLKMKALTNEVLESEWHNNKEKSIFRITQSTKQH